MPSARVAPEVPPKIPDGTSGQGALSLGTRASPIPMVETVPNSARGGPRSVGIGGRTSMRSEDDDGKKRVRLVRRRKRAAIILQVVQGFSTLLSIGFLVWVAVISQTKAFQRQQLTMSHDHVIGYSVMIPLTLLFLLVVNQTSRHKPGHNTKLLTFLVWFQLVVVVLIAFYSSFLFVRYYSAWEILKSISSSKEEDKSTVVQGWIRMGIYSIVHVLLLRFLVDFLIASRRLARLDGAARSGGNSGRRRSVYEK